jgi:hypothetical protein
VLGRWGMMAYYFADRTNPNAPLIFAELQIIAWILDGGFILPLCYALALLSTVYYELRLTTSAATLGLRSGAAVVCAVNAGTVALVFGFTPFTTQVGLQYWFLAGALHGVAEAGQRRRW